MFLGILLQSSSSAGVWMDGTEYKMLKPFLYFFFSMLLSLNVLFICQVGFILDAFFQHPTPGRLLPMQEACAHIVRLWPPFLRAGTVELGVKDVPVLTGLHTPPPFGFKWLLAS